MVISSHPVFYLLNNCPALEELNDKTLKGIMQTFATFMEDRLWLGISSSLCLLPVGFCYQNHKCMEQSQWEILSPLLSFAAVARWSTVWFIHSSASGQQIYWFKPAMGQKRDDADAGRVVSSQLYITLRFLLEGHAWTTDFIDLLHVSWIITLITHRHLRF